MLHMGASVTISIQNVLSGTVVARPHAAGERPPLKTFQSKWIESDNDRPPYDFNVAMFLNVIFKDHA
jgi:hypothetical protein